jgi:acyl-coenzyme A thioesterase PaaI-like protein
MSSQERAFTADFRERAKNNDVPIARLIGFEVKDIANGRATVVLSAGPQHANPMGTLDGGILCGIADAAMGIAFATTLARPTNHSQQSSSKSTFSALSGWRNSKLRERFSSAVGPSATWNAALPTSRTA